MVSVEESLISSTLHRSNTEPSSLAVGGYSCQDDGADSDDQEDDDSDQYESDQHMSVKSRSLATSPAHGQFHVVTMATQMLINFKL